MAKANHTTPTVLVIFGAGGDLTWRKLIPAIYHLGADGWLDDRFAVIGVDLQADGRRELSRPPRATACRAGRPQADAAKWNNFAAPHALHDRRFLRPGHLRSPGRSVRRAGKASGAMPAQHIFYLAIPPGLIGTVTEPDRSRRSFAHDRQRTRIVVEKPFGRDLDIGQGAERHARPRAFTSRRSTASTIISARRRCRTSWRSASPTRSSSRSGTAATSTTCRSPWPRRSASSTAAATTTTPARCAT